MKIPVEQIFLDKKLQLAKKKYASGKKSALLIPLFILLVIIWTYFELKRQEIKSADCSECLKQLAEKSVDQLEVDLCEQLLLKYIL